MKKLFLFIGSFLIFFAAHTQTISPKWESTIGKTFKKINEIDIFKKFKEYDAVLILDSKNEKNTFHKISDSVNSLIIFAKYFPQGNKILAILDIGKIEKGTLVLLRECRLNSKTDGFIVAVVKAKPFKAYFKNIIKAWRIDTKANKFMPISVAGIDCLNEEFENGE